MASVENPGVRSVIGQSSWENLKNRGDGGIASYLPGRGLSDPVGASSRRTGGAATRASALVLAKCALGRRRRTARNRHPIEGHALDAAAGNVRAFRREGARIDAEPGNLR